MPFQASYIISSGAGKRIKTANKKLTKLYRQLTATKAPRNTTNCTCRAKKVEGHNKNLFPALCLDVCPLPLFQLLSVATANMS